MVALQAQSACVDRVLVLEIRASSRGVAMGKRGHTGLSRGKAPRAFFCLATAPPQAIFARVESPFLRIHSMMTQTLVNRALWFDIMLQDSSV